MLNMTMGEEEVMEASGVTSVSDLITYINSMNREELVEYLAENLEDEVDPQDIREMTDENVQEYKRLFIAALTADIDNNTTTTATAEHEEESIWSHDQKEEELSSSHEQNEEESSSNHELKKNESPETEINNFNSTIINEARLQVLTEDEIVHRHRDGNNTMRMTTLKEQISKRANTIANSVVSKIPLLPSTSFPSENNTCELPITPCISINVPENDSNTTMTTLKEQILKKSNNGAESTPAKPIQHSSWSTSSSEGEEVVRIVKRPRVVYNSNGRITAEPPMIEVIVLDEDDDDPADRDNNKISFDQKENRDCTRGPILDAISISISSNADSSSPPKVPEDIFAGAGTFSCRDCESVEKKIVGWTEMNKKDPSFQLATSAHVPENEEQEVADPNFDDDHNLFDNISDLTSNKSLSYNRISCNDSDVIDEYCGAGLLSAKIRIGSSNDDDRLQPIFDLEPGSSYDRQSFEGKCNICYGEVIQKENLAAHVRSSSHRRNLMDLSLKLMGKQQQQQQSSKIIIDLYDHTSNGISNKRGTDDTKEATEPNFEDWDSNLLQQSAAKKSNPDLVTTSRIRSLSPSSSCARRRKPTTKSSRKHRRRKKSTGSGQYKRHRSSRSDCFTSRSRSKAKRRSRSGSRKHKIERRRRSRSMSPPRGYRSPPARYSRRRSHSSSIYSVSSSSSILNSHHHRHRSRSSTSRSPGPSRPNEITLEEKIDAFLKRNRRRSHSSLSAPQDKLSDPDNWMVGPMAKMGEHAIFQEKLTLQAHGKWTDDLEKRWKKMEEDQEEVKRIFTESRNVMIDKLQTHPVYDTEWTKFWRKRYEQLVKEEGKSVEYAKSHDYTEEWQVEWEFITRRILQDKYHQQIVTIRVKYRMDLDSLTALHAQPFNGKTLNGTNNDVYGQPVPPTSNLVVVNNPSGQFLCSFSPLPFTPPAPILHKF